MAPEQAPSLERRVAPGGTAPRGQIAWAGAEIWISAIVAIVLLLMGRGFGGYLVASVLHRPHHTNVTWTEGPLAGSEVAYTDLQGGTYWSESSIFLFGLALLVEAAAGALLLTRFRPKRAVVWVILIVLLAATLYNVVAVVQLFRLDVTPLLSILAVGFGGYLAFQNWALLQASKGQP